MSKVETAYRAWRKAADKGYGDRDSSPDHMAKADAKIRALKGTYEAAKRDETLHYFSSSSGRIELAMTLEQAEGASHQGSCDDDVRALSKRPEIAKQLAEIDPALLVRELKEYGAWEADELADHDQNLQRILWLAAGDIEEENT